jgi:hypothetical protein
VQLQTGPQLLREFGSVYSTIPNVTRDRGRMWHIVWPELSCRPPGNLLPPTGVVVEVENDSVTQLSDLCYEIKLDKGSNRAASPDAASFYYFPQELRWFSYWLCELVRSKIARSWPFHLLCVSVSSTTDSWQFYIGSVGPCCQ